MKVWPQGPLEANDIFTWSYGFVTFAKVKYISCNCLVLSIFYFNLPPAYFPLCQVTPAMGIFCAFRLWEKRSWTHIHFGFGRMYFCGSPSLLYVGEWTSSNGWLLEIVHWLPFCQSYIFLILDFVSWRSSSNYVLSLTWFYMSLAVFLRLIFCSACIEDSLLLYVWLWDSNYTFWNLVQDGVLFRSYTQPLCLLMPDCIYLWNDSVKLQYK